MADDRPMILATFVGGVLIATAGVAAGLFAVYLFFIYGVSSSCEDQAGSCGGDPHIGLYSVSLAAVSLICLVAGIWLTDRSVKEGRLWIIRHPRLSPDD